MQLTPTCGNQPAGQQHFKRDSIIPACKRTAAEELIQARQFKPSFRKAISERVVEEESAAAVTPRVSDLENVIDLDDLDLEDLVLENVDVDAIGLDDSF